MKVINFFAGPGAGKSTTACGLFYQLKIAGYNVELVTEYAKDMTWEQRYNILDDQLYITAKQNRRLARLRGSVDLVVTDSPLLLGMHYATPDFLNGSYQKMLFELWNTYDNVNFFINRKKEYNPIGRNQTEAEAIVIDLKLRNFLEETKLPYNIIPGNELAPLHAFDFLKNNHLIPSK